MSQPQQHRVTASRWLFPTLVGYQRSWLPADVIAGLSAGAVVVPQAMAYATIANLPVQIGLYTCIVPMAVYALLGGSRAMSVSTTSTIATLTATTLVSSGVAAGSTDAVRDLVALTMLVGAILLIARLLRIGSLVEYISNSTLIGIKAAVGVTVAIGQLPRLLGADVAVSGHGFLASIESVVKALPEANLPTIVLSVCSLAALVVFERFLPRLPGSLIVAVVGILLTSFTGITSLGVSLISAVPEGFPAPVLPSFDHVPGLIPGALGIAVLAFLETAAVARSVRVAGEPRVDSNQELLATGAASFIGAFFHTMPAAGGFSQSAVTRTAGAKSQVATLTTAALAVVIALFLGRVISQLPQATLAAMVMIAVLSLIDVRGFIRLAKLSPPEFAVAVITTALGLTFGLLPALGVGVFLTIFIVLSELNRPRVSVGAAGKRYVVIRLNEPLYTANVVGTIQKVEEDAAHAGRPSWVILDATALEFLSVTVIDNLAELDSELAGLGSNLCIAALPDEANKLAQKTEWFRSLTSSGRVFSSVDAAVAAVESQGSGSASNQQGS
ncbi:SulP family inorganic anion transporter [Leifsonia sp. A12D58]|uniref:SulP family inorganic anion transporter n=1 Tax=Leifsonia sp. A12D58 TaxID=3397674 RepID=UPI0039E1BBE8